MLTGTGAKNIAAPTTYQIHKTVHCYTSIWLLDAGDQQVTSVTLIMQHANSCSATHQYGSNTQGIYE